MLKLGRNDKCNCGSGIKFKNCCNLIVKENKFMQGQITSSDKISNIIKLLQQKFSNYIFIDITDNLNETNYREYQLKNYNTNIIMVAEKKVHNNLVFIEREESPRTDIIIMHKGAYRSFIYENFDRILDSLSTGGFLECNRKLT